MKLIASSLRIVGGIFGIPMLAVAIVALFWGSASALILGLVLGTVSLYLIWSAVQMMSYKLSEPAPIRTQLGVADWILRSVLAAIVGIAGFLLGMLAVSHKCLAGSRKFESVAPIVFGKANHSDDN